MLDGYRAKWKGRAVDAGGEGRVLTSATTCRSGVANTGDRCNS